MGGGGAGARHFLPRLPRFKKRFLIIVGATLTAEIKAQRERERGEDDDDEKEEEEEKEEEREVNVPSKVGWGHGPV